MKLINNFRMSDLREVLNDHKTYFEASRILHYLSNKSLATVVLVMLLIKAMPDATGIVYLLQIPLLLALLSGIIAAGLFAVNLKFKWNMYELHMSRAVPILMLFIVSMLCTMLWSIWIDTSPDENPTQYINSGIILIVGLTSVYLFADVTSPERYGYMIERKVADKC
jgi:hypothetical protein